MKHIEDSLDSMVKLLDSIMRQQQHILELLKQMVEVDTLQGTAIAELVETNHLTIKLIDAITGVPRNAPHPEVQSS